jgi:signal transduction histidine kinase
MDGLITNNRHVTRATSPAPGGVERVWLLKDVVAPAVNQVSLVCAQRGLPRTGIQYGRFDEIPQLYVNRSQFQQVVFNLLANAIKYAYSEPSLFHVEVVARADIDRFLLRVRDWGPGIDPQFREKIFQEGFRIAPRGTRGVDGQGVGLWVVRRIVEAHQGTIALSNNLRPTEFTISLPGKLAYSGSPTG